MYESNLRGKEVIYMKNMKKILVVLIAGILLATTSFLIVSGDEEILDQSQTEFEGWSWEIKWNCAGAQSFQPNLSTLTRLELLIWKENNMVMDEYIVEIHESLYTPPIEQVRLKPSEINNSATWTQVIFERPILVEPQHTYYIVSFSNEEMSTYYWGGAYNTNYNRGTQWRKLGIGDWEEYPDYDFCFKTYGILENSPPVAYDDFYSVDEGDSLNVVAPGVLGNDSDPDGDDITAALWSDVSHGVLSLNGDGSFVYTHDGGEYESDSFSYRAFDGVSYSNVATVWITVNPVNDPPVANDDSYSVDEDNALSVVAPGVLGNDNDPENNPLSAVLIDDVSHGVLSLNSDGSFDYIPDSNFNGVDIFIYQASDGTASSENASVTITVESINDPPIANDDYVTVDEDSFDNLIDVLANDDDVEGEDITITNIELQASHGIASTDGDFCYYTPDLNYQRNPHQQSHNHHLQ
jgi:VCBS repeat-containing protein